MFISRSKMLFLLVALVWVHAALCQYNGGVGPGVSTLGIYSISLSGNEFQKLYAGANGQGSTVANRFSLSINGAELASMYSGSSGNGDIKSSLFAQALSGENVNVLFVGGAGRGEQFGMRNSFALSGEAGDIVYYGGTGRGDTTNSIMQNALFDCSLQNMWSGKVSSAWEDVANWTCNELPGVNSIVLITSGVPRYPVVNATTEIKRLQIDPGAFVTIKAGYQLKLNGH